MQLTPKERRRFWQLIDEAKRHYNAMGQILKEIRDDRLYLDDYTSFEECLKVEFDMKKTRAYQLIQHVEVSTLVDYKTGVFAPNELKETHTRAVATLPDEDKVAVLEAAKREADSQSKPLTESIIKKTAAEFLKEQDESIDDETEEEYEDVDELEEQAPAPKPEKDWKFYRAKCIARANELQRDIDDLTNHRKSGNGQRAKDAIEAVQRAIRILEDWR